MLARAKRPEHADEVLTLSEAADLIRVSERTAWELAKAGKIPGRRVGNQWRFLRSELLGALSASEA